MQSVINREPNVLLTWDKRQKKDNLTCICYICQKTNLYLCPVTPAFAMPPHICAINSLCVDFISFHYYIMNMHFNFWLICIVACILSPVYQFSYFFYIKFSISFNFYNVQNFIFDLSSKLSFWDASHSIYIISFIVFDVMCVGSTDLLLVYVGGPLMHLLNCCGVCKVYRLAPGLCQWISHFSHFILFFCSCFVVIWLL